MDAQTLQTAALAAVKDSVLREKADRAAIEVPVGNLHAALKKLRDEPQFAFDMLLDHTAIDWMVDGKFELVYQLYSTAYQHYLMVSAKVARENPVVPTVCDLWRIAEWQEREVYDMFGVLYTGHNDLRRILLEDGWEGFPLRKDYKDDFMLERPQ